ncbi:heterokaryon incompatibility protein-domain-containing protein [Lasiosphaeria miniovina]|uniref:Heterokaryon incompatibility protein-domain-containing protein n=1 Tax=Lasiosphaeria miniovina TaxID=1954250 RepID=A0AA39ZQS9_9PEZI|nr:heterokaryon incompatibility protein-domain-containing protein [Lasiosphaeria miniovina]KAK0701715.1 heterokaryon incompatibility protein-domain-containing protein [Lasiosphaeria miniovina]
MVRVANTAWRVFGRFADNTKILSVNAAVYSPLASENSEFRLLHLGPGPPDSPVKASLTTHPLLDGSAPVYDALSYVWGEPRFTSVIHINGSAFFVTKHLAKCLSALRLPDQERLIWIDAICINQNDIPERQQQVALMGHIYKNADKVRVWMDSDVDLSSPAVQGLVNFPYENTTVGDLGNDPEFWLPLKGFFTDPYWNRLWVQQELFFARTHVFVVPNLEIDGRCVDSFLALLMDIANRDLQYKSGWAKLHLDFDVFSQVKMLGFLRTRPRVPLIQNLVTGLILEVTNPRDRVYGMLSLSNDGDDLLRNGLTIDYKKSVGAVYMDTTLAHIKTSGNLDFLQHASRPPASDSSPSTATDPDRPSWVPNWDTMTGRYITSHPGTRADCRIPILRNQKLPPPPGVLKVHGLRVAAIAQVYHESSSWRVDHLGTTVKNLDDFCQKALETIETDSTTKDDLFRLVIQGLIAARASELLPKFLKSEAEVLKALHDIADGCSEFAALGPDFCRGRFDPGDVMDPVLKHVAHRIADASRLDGMAFTTAGQFVTTIKDSVAVGDHVWILLGSELPMVLRRTSQGHASEDVMEEWEVACPCFNPELKRGEPLATICGEDSNVVGVQGMPKDKHILVYRAVSEIWLC